MPPAISACGQRPPVHVLHIPVCIFFSAAGAPLPCRTAGKHAPPIGSEIERGIANPTVLTLEKISNYFSIPLSRLLAPEEDSANTALLKAELHARIAAMDSTAQLRTVLKFVSNL